MRRVTFALWAGLLLAPASGLAQTVWFELLVPGSLDGVLGPGLPRPSGPRLLPHLIGILHDRDTPVAHRREAAALRPCLADLHALRTRWRAVELEAGDVSLEAATGERGPRRTLEALLGLFELRLQRQGPSWRVAAIRTDQEPRVTCGAGRAWRADEVQRRLNAGEPLAWDVPHFAVSLPLSPGFWLQLLYDERASGDEAATLAAERSADLTARLVTDARAARMYLGLAALDDATLAWFLDHPRTLLRLNEAELGLFARFAGSLRVRDGELQAPGGPAAAFFWERLVGASPADPERFLDRLFAWSSGRAALAWHMLSRLPEPQQRFVLGLWRTDARDRRRGHERLQRVLDRLPPPDPAFARPGLPLLADAGVADPAERTPGPALCGVPPGEAIALTWDIRYQPLEAGIDPLAATNGYGIFACGPRRCTIFASPNEPFALGDVGVDVTRAEFRQVCRVQARMNFLSDDTARALYPTIYRVNRPRAMALAMERFLTARMYRLGYDLQTATRDRFDLREFIDH